MSQSGADCWVVIPASGRGQRMAADRPKQYLPLGDKTILEITLDNLLSFAPVRGAVVVVDAEDAYWPDIAYQHEKPVYSCHGGEQRHLSVCKGLKALQEQTNANPVVLIHDAVRPFVLHRDLQNLLKAVETNVAGAILAAPLADTLKLADDNDQIIRTQSRDHLWRAFTPQAFRLDKILAALEQVISQQIVVTDDASAMEFCGLHPSLVIGDAFNIKITHPQDIAFAELLWRRWILSGDYKSLD